MDRVCGHESDFTHVWMICSFAYEFIHELVYWKACITPTMKYAEASGTCEVSQAVATD